MNKKLFLLSPIVVPIFTPLISTSCGCSYNDNRIILTNNEVINNFQPNQKWYGKTFLSHDDFKNYKSINVDAFDNINQQLEYIELPSSVILNNEKQPILWEQIKKINVYDVGEKNLVIKIIFYFH